MHRSNQTTSSSDAIRQHRRGRQIGSAVFARLVVVTTPTRRPRMRDGPQVASWTHAGLHIGLADNSRRCSRSICTACFVVWRPRRAADTSTNQRHGFLCRRIASMEHAADTAQAAAVDHYFLSPTENVFVPVWLRTPERLIIISFPSPTLSFIPDLKPPFSCKSFPSQPFFFFFRTDSTDSADFYCYF